MNNPCPCGSGRSYNECCYPIISEKKEATTCEELMRSRYTAFTNADVNYLMRSHHSSTRPIKDRKRIQKWAASVHWIGLQIIATEAGKIADDIGYVEFRALYMEKGKMQQIHEKSLFKRENKKWVYVSGEHFMAN